MACTAGLVPSVAHASCPSLGNAGACPPRRCSHLGAPGKCSCSGHGASEHYPGSQALQQAWRTSQARPLTPAPSPAPRRAQPGGMYSLCRQLPLPRLEMCACLWRGLLPRGDAGLAPQGVQEVCAPVRGPSRPGGGLRVAGQQRRAGRATWQRHPAGPQRALCRPHLVKATRLNFCESRYSHGPMSVTASNQT